MPDCDHCGAALEGMPFRCEYCELSLCADCRLPEQHDCDGPPLAGAPRAWFDEKFRRSRVMADDRDRSPASEGDDGAERANRPRREADAIEDAADRVTRRARATRERRADDADPDRSRDGSGGLATDTQPLHRRLTRLVAICAVIAVIGIAVVFVGAELYTGLYFGGAGANGGDPGAVIAPTPTETATPGTPSTPTPTAHPANPYGSRTLTVAIDGRNQTRFDAAPAVREGLRYWERFAESYAGYPVEYVVRPDASDPDVLIEINPTDAACEREERVLGCAHLVQSAPPPDPAEVVLVDHLCRETFVAAVQHEIGHTLGLEHDDAPQAVMSPTVESTC